MRRDILVIIDDSELDLAILNVIFKDIFRVKCLSNAKNGMEFIIHNYKKICAILLDICLEEKGEGLSVLKEIKQLKEISNLPVFLMTTDANKEYVVAGVQQGAFDFLVKPVDPCSVQNRVCEKVRALWAEREKTLDKRD